MEKIGNKQSSKVTITPKSTSNNNNNNNSVSDSLNFTKTEIDSFRNIDSLIATLKHLENLVKVQTLPKIFKKLNIKNYKKWVVNGFSIFEIKNDILCWKRKRLDYDNNEINVPYDNKEIRL
eukprot:TRINITY_DN1864_c0_g1_i1.p1 TRINITY_DN1864_c0_g1~~TRINITY_DN1864_c0_g1_i1.p1  ORF type:complete len:121 (-),score=25.69 TRINITY_DN1864_c0_g1_i1:56-418(-)